MTTKTFATILMLISTAAFFLSARSFYFLHKIGLLGKNYWKEKGLKNLYLAILWILLFIGGVSLFLEKGWATDLLKITFGLFGLAILVSWLRHILTAIRLLFLKKPIHFSELLQQSPCTEEVMKKSLQPLEKLAAKNGEETDFFNEAMEETESNFDISFKQEMRKLIIGKTIGFLIVSAILYLGWQCL